MRVLARIQQLRRVLPAVAITVMAISTISVLAIVGIVIFPKSYRVATWYSPTPEIGFHSSTTGVLSGQTNADGSACFWLGSGDERTALLWAPGYSARDKPLRIVDAKGHMIATVGDLVTFGGGLATDEVIAKGIFGCPKTPSVRSVNQQPFGP